MEETKQTDENQLQNEPVVNTTEDVAKTDGKQIPEGTTPVEQETPSQEIKQEHSTSDDAEKTSPTMENLPQQGVNESQTAPIAQVPPFVSRTFLMASMSSNVQSMLPLNFPYIDEIDIPTDFASSVLLMLNLAISANRFGKSTLVFFPLMISPINHSPFNLLIPYFNILKQYTP